MNTASAILVFLTLTASCKSRSTSQLNAPVPKNVKSDTILDLATLRDIAKEWSGLYEDKEGNTASVSRDLTDKEIDERMDSFPARQLPKLGFPWDLEDEGTFYKNSDEDQKQKIRESMRHRIYIKVKTTKDNIADETMNVLNFSAADPYTERKTKYENEKDDVTSVGTGIEASGRLDNTGVLSLWTGTYKQTIDREALKQLKTDRTITSNVVRFDFQKEKLKGGKTTRKIAMTSVQFNATSNPPALSDVHKIGSEQYPGEDKEMIQFLEKQAKDANFSKTMMFESSN